MQIIPWLWFVRVCVCVVYSGVRPLEFNFGQGGGLIVSRVPKATISGTTFSENFAGESLPSLFTTDSFVLKITQFYRVSGLESFWGSMVSNPRVRVPSPSPSLLNLVVSGPSPSL
jgi:hypothetical protein